MRTTRTALTLLAILSLARGAALAKEPTAASNSRESMLVTVAWLAQHLSDPGLVLLHVGDKVEYEAWHIPGARYVAVSDISVSDRTGGGLTLEMPSAEELRQRLAALGISDGSRIVVYPGKDWLSPATRVMFTLDYAGLGARAALLDGGMDAWVAEGHPVTASVPAPGAGTLSPLKTRPIVVDAGRVREALGRPGFAVVDGRSVSYYDGIDTGGAREKRHCTGHIAGAGNAPFSAVFDDDQKLRSPEELAALLAKAGVKEGDTVIAYCHIGQQATAVLFAARTLGHPVMLYDGSFEDWSRRAGFPVESPSR
ncbi:MAG: sulfurtransferase [Holophagales bacterium]|nr:sulfurtransferase [Holophagales bacterium]MBK9965587.1 sulfurtransferase [Holophagales bacterium]